MFDLTDGRKPYQPNSQYDISARWQIWGETVFLVFLMLIAFVSIFLTWRGILGNWLALSAIQQLTAQKYIYYSASGLLGGVTFGIKFFYHIVAKGYWHKDRRVWRVSSPIIAMTIAFIVGALFESGAISVNSFNTSCNAKVICIGFITGYFADQAVGKMREIADVIFGQQKKE